MFHHACQAVVAIVAIGNHGGINGFGQCVAIGVVTICFATGGEQSVVGIIGVRSANAVFGGVGSVAGWVIGVAVALAAEYGVVGEGFAGEAVQVVVAVAGGGAAEVDDLVSSASCVQSVIKLTNHYCAAVLGLHLGEAVEGVVDVHGGVAVGVANIGAVADVVITISGDLAVAVGNGLQSVKHVEAIAGGLCCHRGRGG